MGPNRNATRPADDGDGFFDWQPAIDGSKGPVVPEIFVKRLPDRVGKSSLHQQFRELPSVGILHP